MTPRAGLNAASLSGVPPVVPPAPAWDHRTIPEHAEPAEPTPSFPPPDPRSVSMPLPASLPAPTWPPPPGTASPLPPPPSGPATGHRRTWWRAPRTGGPLRRSTSDRIAGGVAGGLSARLGVDANIIRIVFVLAAIGAGTGLAAYVVAWLVIPRDGTTTSILRHA